MRIAGRSIKDVRTEQVIGGDERRIAATVQEDGLFRAAIPDAKSATNYQAIIHLLMCQRKRAGAPGETNLRSPVVVAGVIEITADADGGAGERCAGRADLSDIEIAELFVNRAEVLVAKADVEREVGTNLEIILNIAGIAVGTNVMTGLGQSAGEGIESGVLLEGSVVSEVPKILEKILGQSATGIGVGVLIAIEIEANFQSVTAEYLGHTIMKVVGGLIEYPRSVGTEDKRKATDVSQCVENVLSQTERVLGIRLQFVEPPARYVEARLVYQSRPEGVLPQESAALVEPVGVPKIRRTRVAVERSLIIRDPIDTEGNEILMRDLKI